MELVSSHLSFVLFFKNSYENLELLCEFPFLRLSMRGLFSKCVQYLHCNILVDHLCALYLSLCHVLLCLFCMRNDLHCYLLERFHLRLLILLNLCLCGYEFCLQLLHILYSFEALSDLHHLLPMLEVLDSCACIFLFLVPLSDLLILLQLCP
jgi:hypothetical protein